MRVISQDGTIDMPYEMSIVWCEDSGAVLLQPIGEIGEYQTFAKYSTEEKAKKAMEMLRDTYQYGKRVAVPKFDESGIDKEDDITIYNTRLINDFFKGGTYVPTKVFQFPKDEDVEV